MNLFNREPAMVMAALSAIIALGVAFGLDMSGEQTGAIMACAAAVMGLVVRQRVTPTSTARHAKTV